MCESNKLSGNIQGVDYFIAESRVADECIDEFNLCTEHVNSTEEVTNTSVGHQSGMVPGFKAHCLLRLWDSSSERPRQESKQVEQDLKQAGFVYS